MDGEGASSVALEKERRKALRDSRAMTLVRVDLNNLETHSGRRPMPNKTACVLMMLGLAGCTRHEAAAPTSAPPTTDALRPIATVRQVMLGITVPASNAVFAVAGQAPADDAGWEAVEASALAVAESGNLLLVKPRAVDDGDWKRWSVALVDAGVKAAKAAHSKDADATGVAGDDMYNVCEQCHAKYLKKS